MLTKFWEGLSGKLAERWVATILTPGFIFWFGGFWVIIFRFGWKPLEIWFNQQSQTLQIALLVSNLLGILVSSILVQRLDLVILRLLEGYYWPRWVRRLSAHWQLYGFKQPKQPLRDLRKKKRALRSQGQDLSPDELTQYSELQSEWESLPFNRLVELQSKQATLDDAESDKYVELMLRLRYTPFRESQRMPTQLGNILRAAELRPLIIYGLDAVICWPYLWLLLPDNVKKELVTVRSDLDIAARIWLWSILFIGWSVWAWWAAIIGLLSALLTYRWMLSIAETYGAFLDASFDLYRKKLYEALGWKIPDTLEEERKIGQQLTQFLLYGSDPYGSVFPASGATIKPVTFKPDI
ncbi:MAG: hypothetical protein AB1589_37305 [Cyanobacteriota bacterium]